MLVGAYGAGKTSTKRSLFNEPYEEKHLSTDGADIYNINITEWIIKEYAPEYQGKRSIEETQKTLGDVLAVGMAKKKWRLREEKPKVVPAKLASVIDAVKFKGEKMKDVQERLTRRLEEAADVDKPDIYFSLWDFAGQSVYYITHQVFLGNRVIFALVTDLSKSLDDVMSTVLEDEWTVKEFLSFWMNSIHAHAVPGSNIRLKLPDGRNRNIPAPPVILIGTKKDLLGQSNRSNDGQDIDVEKEVERRLKEIRDYISRHATKAVNAHLVDMIAIDNKARKEDGTVNDSEVEELRKSVQDYAMEYFFLGKVPVKWIRLELSMRKLQREKLHLEEAKDIGKKLEMTEDETNEALAFFHSVGEILHFTSTPELENTIILDMEWLVNLFTILITKTIAYKEELKGLPAKISNLIHELQHEGRLHEELLDYLLKRHDRSQDKIILLATAEMYDILFRMPETVGENPVYYLPSLLQKDTSGKNGIVCPAGSKSCAPIYLHFAGNFLPEGLFYRLIVRCLKQWPNEGIVLRKHRARIFIKDDGFHITLCKEESDIELKVLIMPDTPNSVDFTSESLTSVRNVVERELKNIIDTYTPNLKYKVCIKCHCPNHRPGKLLQGSEDTDDRCIAVKVEKGSVRAICRNSVQQMPCPDVELWYGEGAEQAAESSLTADNAHVNLCSGERETRSHSGINVLTIGREWSARKGTMATIHRLTSNLAAETGRKVNAIVIEANEGDKEDAVSKGVHLVLPDDTDPEEKPTLALLTKYHSIHYPSLKKMSDVNVVIGHATTTSKAALDIQREYFRGKKVILFNHVLPEDTEVTRDEFTPTRVQQGEATLCQEVSRCRVVFSVGPRVYHHFENKFSTLPSVKHELFLPLPAETFFQIGMKKPSITCQKQILTYGRIGHVNHLVGYDVVARGLSKYVTDLKKRKPTFNSPVWLISGIQEEGVRSASDFIKKHVTSGDLHLKVTFNWSNSQIINDLQESHLCLIPSHVEPFGMFGLEAIAAGIPVLVNSNSGLAMFLTKYMHPDKAAAVILDVGVTDTKRKRDINRWANRIAEVFEDYDHAFERAQEMKKMLRDCHAIKETHTVFKRECCVKEN